MTALIISQTVFYIVFSIIMIVLGLLLAFAIYQVIRILRNALHISNDIEQVYTKTKKKVKKVVSSMKM